MTITASEIHWNLLDVEPEGEIVMLRGVGAVAFDALKCGWRLESKGVSFRIEDGVLVARPRELLTAADCNEIRRHLPDLKLIVSATPEVL